MAGDPHPADDLLVDGVDVSKADFRSFIRTRTSLVLASASEVQSTDLGGQLIITIKENGRSYLLDTLDTTSPHDGINVLVDANGLRFILFEIEGVDGEDGSTLLFGAGPPSSSPDLGSDEDLYLDTTNGDVYYKVPSSPVAIWTLIDNLHGVDGTGLFSRVRVCDSIGLTPLTDYQVGDTVDGVVLAQGDLVLRAAVSSSPDMSPINGVYVVPPASPVVTPPRDSSFDTYDEHPGAFFSVMEGTVNGDSLWYCTSNKGGVLDTTPLVIVQFEPELTAHDVAFAQSPALANSTGTQLDHIIRELDAAISLRALDSAVLKQGVHEVFIDAGSMRPRATSGAAPVDFDSGAGDVTYRGMAFDEAAQEYAHFKWVPPKSWDGGTFTFRPVWVSASGQLSPLQNVRFDLAARAMGDGEAYDGAFGTAQFVDDDFLGAVVHVGSQSAAVVAFSVGSSPDAPADYDLIAFQVSRVVASDNLAGDAVLLGVVLTFNVTAATDA